MSQYIEEQLAKARKALAYAMPMTDEQWAGFSQGLRIRSYERDEVILRIGEREDYLSMVLDGQTRHYLLNNDGTDKSFDFSFQHEFSFSYVSFIGRMPSRFCITTMQPTILASIHYDFLQGLYEAHPASNLIGRMAAEQYCLWREEREVSLLMDSAEERYLKVMEEQPHYLEKIPLKYLASYLNLNPASLSRIRRKVAEWERK